MIYAWMFDDVDEYFLSRVAIKKLQDDSFIGHDNQPSFLIEPFVNRAIFHFLDILLRSHRLLHSSKLALTLSFGQFLLIFLQ